MVGHFQLTNDISQISTISSQRVMVAVPLLYVFLTHYLFQFLRLFRGDPSSHQRLNDLGKRIYLYGVASLFSISFLQGSIILSSMAWLTLICIIIIHCFVFMKQAGNIYHNNGLLVYYTLLLIWFSCIIALYSYDAHS